MVGKRVYRDWICCKKKNETEFYKKTYADNCVTSLNTLLDRLGMQVECKTSMFDFDSIEELKSFWDKLQTNQAFIDLDATSSSNHRYNNAIKFLYQYLMDLDDCGDNPYETVVIAKEGNKKSYYTTKYERNPMLRRKAIEIHKPICYVCKFDFYKTYGELEKGYIEVHHKVPLYDSDGEVEVNPETDLVCLCANCHRMIHRSRKEILTVEELIQIVNDRT